MQAASGYYRPGDSWLHRRNPVTKLLGLAWVILAAFLLPPPVLVGLAAGCLALAGANGLGRSVVRALRIPAVLIASILVVNALFFPGAVDVIARFGPLVLSREGIAFGVVTAGRVLVAFVASITFLQSTLPDDLLEALVARGASHRFAWVVLSAVQMVPRLQESAATILEAQQARGLEIHGSIGRRVRALLPLVGPVLLGSLIDVRERTFALEARGFGAGGVRTAYRVVLRPPARPVDPPRHRPRHRRRHRLAVRRLLPGDQVSRTSPPPGLPAPLPALELEDLEVRYHGRSTSALAGIDLAVAAGEMVGVAGRNGAGKSTLALAAAAFIPRVVRARLGGRVVIDGRPVAETSVRDLLGRVGIVFSTPSNQLSGSKLTVREELAFGLENLGLPREAMDARIDRTLASLGIDHLAGRLPTALSGGEQQRVAIASILCMGPGLLVLDEPTAQLDPAATRAVADLLAGRVAAGTAVLVTEHKSVVLGATARCLVLDGGSVAGLDIPGAVLGPDIGGRAGVAVPAGARSPTRSACRPPWPSTSRRWRTRSVMPARTLARLPPRRWPAPAQGSPG